MHGGGNWETEHYKSVMEITSQTFIVSWILTGTSFAVYKAVYSMVCITVYHLFGLVWYVFNVLSWVQIQSSYRYVVWSA
jgi:hypothetical protein